MRIAVYGGSFNPPHVGHAMVASWLRWTERVDEVWLVPAFSHAFGKDLAPYAARVAWCRALADAIGPSVRVSEVESRLPVPSYTLNTLLALRGEHPEHHLRLVLGADAVAEAARWYRFDEIQREFAPLVVGRGGWPPVDGAPVFPPVSSSEIRDRLRRGLPVDHLVPAAVLAAMGDWTPPPWPPADAVAAERVSG